MGNEAEEIVLHSSATSEHKLLDRMGQTIEVLKNRWVRRVEWRIEGINEILRGCQPTDMFLSSVFAAAGAEGMQLHFYPKGCDEDGPEGYCSLFLSCRPYTWLRCHLFIGSQSRGMEYAWQTRGDISGKSRFCPLQAQVDPDDSLTVGVEISEFRGEAVDKGQLGSQQSILRLKKQDPSGVEEMTRVFSLPALTATKAQASVTKQRERRSRMDRTRSATRTGFGHQGFGVTG